MSKWTIYHNTSNGNTPTMQIIVSSQRTSPYSEAFFRKELEPQIQKHIGKQETLLEN
jgi:hypothetical protein